MNIKDERELLSKPGDTIVETLEHMRMSQAELGKRMGKTPSKINDLVSGKETITVATAVQLEKVLGINTQFWLNREASYREKLLRLEQEEFLEQCVSWLDHQPVKELQQSGFIKSQKKDTAMVHEFLHFYGVDTPKQWESLYVQDYAETSFRKNNTYTTALGSMAAWLRIGELGMRNVDLPEYSKDKFKETLSALLSLVRQHPEDFAGQLRDACRKAGVAIVYTPGLPKAPISGATRWVGKNPLIQLTDRYKTNDQFWFTFFHEAGHILLHGKKEVFLENFEGYERDEEKEKEADEFSENWLLPKDFISDLPAGTITEKDVKRIARTYDTHPAIIIHRLQKQEIVPYHFGTDLKMRVVLSHYIYRGGLNM